MLAVPRLEALPGEKVRRWDNAPSHNSAATCEHCYLH